MLPKYIIFDWDNTLADSSYIMKEAMDKTLSVLKKYGADIKENLPNYWHLSLLEVIKNPSGDLHKIGESLYFFYYQSSNIRNIKLFSGVVDLLQYLHENNVKLYVISNKRNYFLYREIMHLGISQFFERIHGVGDSVYFKPSREVVFHTLGKEVPGHHIVFVGDSYVDLMCAQSCQCEFILVNHYKNNKSDSNQNIFSNIIINTQEKLVDSTKITEVDSFHVLLSRIKNLVDPHERVFV